MILNPNVLIVGGLFLALIISLIGALWRDVAAWLIPVDYETYIHSRVWKLKAGERRRRDAYKCRDCGRKDAALEVHHLSYDRLGYEFLDDLITLCGYCHEKRHKR